MSTVVKLLFAISGFLAINTCFGQKVINNLKSDKHKPVKGTKFLLIPPDGFMDAPSFQGFQQLESSSSILVMEIPGSFSETIKGFNEQELKTQGVMLKRKEAIKINGYQGLFMAAQQFAYGNFFTKYILIFGDTKSTFVVNGMYPKELTDLDKDIVQSMYSIIYESTLNDDLLKLGKF